jgi:hypothetical protein
MKKPIPVTRDEFHSRVIEVYRYAREVSGRLYIFLELIRSNRFPQQFKRGGTESESLQIPEVLREISQLREKLSGQADEIHRVVKEILSEDWDREPFPWTIVRACDKLSKLIEEFASLRTPQFTLLPISGIDLDWVDSKPWLTVKGIEIDSIKANRLFFDWFRIVGDLKGDNIEEAFDRELGRIWSGLPGVLAYLNSLTISKPTKQRTKDAIQREKDLLYLLEQYEEWKRKKEKETGRKRFNPSQWLDDQKRWGKRVIGIFDKYADPGFDDAIEIDRLIKNARKVLQRSEKDRDQGTKGSVS